MVDDDDADGEADHDDTSTVEGLSGSLGWLSNCLVKKLVRWMGTRDVKSQLPPSLSLINVEAYIHKYNHLKTTYAAEIIKVS